MGQSDTHENSTSSTGQRQDGTEKQPNREMKLKERLSADQLKTLLKQWLEAIEQNKDFQVQIKGETCHVPHQALAHGKLVAEYEIEEDEHEFELELKWKPSETGASTVQ